MSILLGWSDDYQGESGLGRGVKVGIVTTKKLVGDAPKQLYIGDTR